MPGLDSTSDLMYNPSMKNPYDYSGIRIKTETLLPLRRVHAETGESILAIVHRLAIQEAKRLGLERPAVQVETADPEELLL